MPTKEYVRQTDGAFRISGTRVSLDSLVYLFREGTSAESMVESYPSLTLEQVHGALAYYLARKEEIDEYMLAGERETSQEVAHSLAGNAELIAKLRRSRHANPISG